jgi:hypothetical protein
MSVSLRGMAEDGDLTEAVQAWWDANLDRGGSIASVLLLRACEQLGILPEGVSAAEWIDRCKLPAYEPPDPGTAMIPTCGLCGEPFPGEAYQEHRDHCDGAQGDE